MDITKGELYLQNSLLRTLPTSCGDFSGVLDLRGSPVDLCNCEMAWLKLIQSAQILVDSIMCSGSQWQDLSYRELYEMCTTPTDNVKGNQLFSFRNLNTDYVLLYLADYFIHFQWKLCISCSSVVVDSGKCRLANNSYQNTCVKSFYINCINSDDKEKFSWNGV